MAKPGTWLRNTPHKVNCCLAFVLMLMAIPLQVTALRSKRWNRRFLVLKSGNRIFGLEIEDQVHQFKIGNMINKPITHHPSPFFTRSIPFLLYLCTADQALIPAGMTVKINFTRLAGPGFHLIHFVQ